MPTYTTIVRVELHKDDARTQPHSIDAKEYKTLHEEMWSRGFRRFYKSDAGHLIKLPPAEYVIEKTYDTGEAAREDAYDRAKAAATIATSKERFSLLVNAEGWITSWHLEGITKDPDGKS